MHCLKTKKKNHKIFCSMYMHALGSIFEFLFFVWIFFLDLVVMRTLNALVQQYPVIIRVYAHLVIMDLA